MSDIVQFQNPDGKPKSFWKRPEGVTGLLFMSALLLGGGYLIFANLAAIIALLQNTIYLAILLGVLAMVVYMVLDPKMRNLIWYMYKSVMRAITGMFVQIDPIGILRNYIEDLQDNLLKMRKQIGALKGQMRKIQGLMEKNKKDINNNLKIAQAARDKGKEQQMILSSRKAARLKESNQKYNALYKKMEILYRILNKMHQNSEILLEDTKDQVELKVQERKAIRASHSAMKSAMTVISGDPDKRAMFDMAMEAVADDVANKVGEMERFMEMSSSFMDSVDLQNGIFEDEGLKMLEQWEQKSTLMLMGDSSASGETLDLDGRTSEPQVRTNKSGGQGSYDNLFD